MKKPKQLRKPVVSGSEHINSHNINQLIDEYNNLVEVVNMLIEEHPNQLIRNKLIGIDGNDR